jgi:hypothetical protein
MSSWKSGCGLLLSRYTRPHVLGGERPNDARLCMKSSTEHTNELHLTSHPPRPSSHPLRAAAHPLSYTSPWETSASISTSYQYSGGPTFSSYCPDPHAGWSWSSESSEPRWHATPPALSPMQFRGPSEKTGRPIGHRSHSVQFISKKSSMIARGKLVAAMSFPAIHTGTPTCFSVANVTSISNVRRIISVTHDRCVVWMVSFPGTSHVK